MERLDDPHFEGKLLLAVSDFMTVMLLTAGSALAVLSGYGVMTDTGAVLVFCAAASAVSAAIHSLSRPWWRIGTAAGLAAVCWLARKPLAVVLEWLALKMGVFYFLPLDWERGTPEEEIILPCLLLLTAVLAWAMGWMAVRARRWYLAAMLNLILVLPAIQMGVLPSWGAMLAAFAGWGSMLLTALYGRKDPDSLGRARLLSLTGMAALLLILVMALPMEGYDRPQWATNARTNLILGVRHRMERYFDMEALDNGILADLGIDLSVPEEGSGQGAVTVSTPEVSGGGSGQRENLLAAGPRRYTGRRVLTVSTDQTDGGRIYLRGGSLGTYTGDSWEMVEEGGPPFFAEGGGAPEAQPSLYPARTAAEVTEYTMSIRDIYGQGVRFYPYRLTEAGGWTDEAGILTPWDDQGWMDGFLLAGPENYQVNYIPGGPEDGFVPLPGTAAAEEERYQTEAAYSYRYLDVPNEARRILELLLSRDYRDGWTMIIQSLEQELEGVGGAEREALEETLRQIREMMDRGLTLEDFDPVVELPEDAEQFRRPLTAAAQTAALLAELAEYDAETPAMSPGEDFVTHFLTEGRGYCIHFATAGALLLRMQGIPARYVTGYVVQLDGRGRGEALDSDAHAWVEIYLDGYGWYPVEMTPGYAGGGNGISLADESEVEDPSLPDEQAPEEEAPEERPEEEPDQALQPEETLPEEEGPEKNAFAAALLRALARAGLALCVLGAVYALARLLRRQEKTGPDTNRSVLCAYRRYQRVLRLGGAEDETLEELGRKAKFSQHTLTEEERETVWRRLDEAAETAEKRRKKSLRWLFSLLRPVL